MAGRSLDDAELGTKRKVRDEEKEDESESSSDDSAGPQPAPPGQTADESDTDGEAGPPKPIALKPKKKRKLPHEKVNRANARGFGKLCILTALSVQTAVARKVPRVFAAGQLIEKPERI